MKSLFWQRFRARLWMISYIAKSLAYLLWPTPKRVRRYFSHGIRTRWEWVKCTEWREMPNDWIISAHVTAQGNDGEMFYQGVSISGQVLAEIKRSSGALARMTDLKMNKQMDAIEALHRFLDPMCRCKHGKHWRCGIHRTWSN